jgi:hypothetical protein
MRALLVAIVIAIVVGGCNAIAGIEPGVLRQNACDTTQAGTTRLRVGNLVPTVDRYDVCVKRTDGSSPLDGVPLPGNADAGPSDGIGYEQLLAPVAVPAGSYSITLHATGSGCSDAPIATTSACLAPGSTSVFAVGDGASVQLVTMAESTTLLSGTRLRFVNAAAGEPSLDFGREQGDLPDATITPIFTSISFGASAHAGSSPSDGPIDANGYVVLTPPAANFPLAAAPPGAPNATIAKSPVLSAQRYTMFAVGSVSDIRFPEELLLCDETAEQNGLTSCGVSYTVTIDAYGTTLFGPFSPLSSLRHDPLIDAVATLTDPDFVCLQGLTFDADKMAIQTKALATIHFPYSIKYVDDLDTPVDDPTDQSGHVPTPPTTPACATPSPQLDALIDCIDTKCAATPGDPKSQLSADATACMSTQCPTQVEMLLVASPECWMCAFGQLSSYVAIGDARTTCLTDPRARLAYGGTSDTLLLSRHALRDAKQWVLPSSLTRATIQSATVTLPNGVDLDVYCVSTRTPGDGTLLPYTGLYGNGQTGNAAWRQELLLQTGKVIRYLKSTSVARGHRALVAGQFNCGPEVPPTLGPSDTESWDLLRASFALALPPGAVPPCTLCVDNPILTPPGQKPSGQSTLGTYTVLANVPLTDVVSASAALTDAVLDDPPQTYKVPLSFEYDYRATVRIRP